MIITTLDIEQEALATMGLGFKHVANRSILSSLFKEIYGDQMSNLVFKTNPMIGPQHGFSWSSPIILGNDDKE